MITQLMTKYNFDEVKDFQTIKSNDNVSVYRFTSHRKHYILKSCQSVEQSKREYKISVAKRMNPFTPAIIETVDKAPYISYESVIYTLQHAVEDICWVDSEQLFERLGHHLGIQRRILKDMEIESVSDNQFSLAISKKKLLNYYEQVYRFQEGKRIFQDIERLIDLEYAEEELIHGDMTHNNILYDGNKF